jgi:hypothetical protein
LKSFYCRKVSGGVHCLLPLGHFRQFSRLDVSHNKRISSLVFSWQRQVSQTCPLDWFTL